jgi:hypothetical protein
VKRSRSVAVWSAVVSFFLCATALAGTGGNARHVADAPVSPSSATASGQAATTSGTSGTRDLSAQLREAGDRHELAFKLYDEGAYEAALSELKRAYELAPTFRILYNLGVMSLAVHDHAGATEYFERYLIEGGEAIPNDVRAQIGEKLTELARLVARVSIHVNVAGAEVSVDDRVVGVAPLAGVLRLNAGSRRLSAHAHGWLPDSTVVSLAGGDDRRVTLTLTDPRSRVVSPAEMVSARTFPWAGFAATALLTAGSVASGVEALAAQRDFERKRRVLGISSSELREADSRAFRWSVAADALGVAALAAGGYSLYLTLAAPDAPSPEPPHGQALRLDVTASGLMLSGGF